jgi:hypothetical protein
VAATITDQADLVDAYLVIRSEIERLQTTEMRSDNCVGIHTAAWSAVKKDLLKRRLSIEEDDLSDTDELIDATLYYALHIFYRMSEIETDQVEAKRWYKRYKKEMTEVQLTISDVEQTRSGERTTIYRQ